MAVFHLKYRPKKISDLDSEEVRKALKSVLNKKDDMPQSFLFTGPKGAGKTSAARILAKSVNCLSPKDGEPCGECEACQAIERGSSVDVIEMDAASNRGIDEVRGIRDQAYLLPVKLKKKVFIIDEVHMLTKEAFNALLKLIEEPPAHTLFILCTTDSEKIPDTVLSRLIRIDFKKGKKEEIRASLAKSAKGEGIKVDEEVFDLIFDRSEGSFRNAQRLLTEVIMELGNTVSIKDAEASRVLSRGGYSALELEEDLGQQKEKEVLEKLEEMADRGVDFAAFRRELITYFQEKLLTFYTSKGKSPQEGLKLQEVVKLLNLLITAGKIEKEAVVDQLPIELAIIEFFENNNRSSASSADKQGSETEKQDVKKNEKTTINKVSDPPEVEMNSGSSVSRVDRQEEKVQKESIEEEREENESVSEAAEIEESQVVVETSNDNLEITVEEIEKNWGVILQKVKPFNHSVEAFLRAARPVSIERDRVVIEVFYPFHKDKLEEDKNRRIVEDRFIEIFNVNLRMECVLAKTKQKPIEIKNDTVLTEDKVENKADVKVGEKEMYDIAKEIFG